MTRDDRKNQLERDELVGFLNELLEAERAGAKAAGVIAADAGSPEVSELMKQIKADYSRFCATLEKLVSERGGHPSAGISRFYDRAVAPESLADRISLLRQGQEWAVELLSNALPAVREVEVHAALREMCIAHEHNSERCGGYVGPEQAGA